jgi:hypothetical protein
MKIKLFYLFGRYFKTHFAILQLPLKQNIDSATLVFTPAAPASLMHCSTRRRVPQNVTYKVHTSEWEARTAVCTSAEAKLLHS